MRVLVTGASGYVGSRLVPALLGAGHEVVAAARDTDGLDRFAWADRVERRFFDFLRREEGSPSPMEYASSVRAQRSFLSFFFFDFLREGSGSASSKLAG